MIGYLWAANGKCGVFITSHSHQAILISIPIPMKLAQRCPFPWEFHGTQGTQYRLISTCPLRAATHGQTISADNCGLCVTGFRLWLMNSIFFTFLLLDLFLCLFLSLLSFSLSVLVHELRFAWFEICLGLGCGAFSNGFVNNNGSV